MWTQNCWCTINQHWQHCHQDCNPGTQKWCRKVTNLYQTMTYQWLKLDSNGLHRFDWWNQNHPVCKSWFRSPNCRTISHFIIERCCTRFSYRTHMLYKFSLFLQVPFSPCLWKILNAKSSIVHTLNKVLLCLNVKWLYMKSGKDYDNWYNWYTTSTILISLNWIQENSLTLKNPLLFL